MHALKCALAAAAALGLTAPAYAQDSGYDGAQFVKAIQDGKLDDAYKLFTGKPTLANARDFNGQTALVAAIDKGEEQWAGYLLKEGADPNLPGAMRETPLMAAARRGLPQVVDWLIQLGAKVDADNNRGETALIVAVQNVQDARDPQLAIVETLLDSGADPDKADSAQGYTARDYARQKNRVPKLLQLIQAKKPKP